MTRYGLIVTIASAIFLSGCSGWFSCPTSGETIDEIGNGDATSDSCGV